MLGRLPCKRRTCPRYARLWALDWRVVLLENLIAYGGKAVMFTVTPPGADQLPWDTARCSHRPGLKCSGRDHGCVIEAGPRRRWNESFQKRLSRLYESAQAATRRDAGQRATILTIGKEAQKRGATHAHYIVGCRTAALELRASKAFRGHLERLSGAAPVRVRAHQRQVREAEGRSRSRGVPVELLRPRPRSQGSACGGGDELGAAAAGAVGLAASSPQATGTTMRNKRRQRHLWVCNSRGLG